MVWVFGVSLKEVDLVRTRLSTTSHEGSDVTGCTCRLVRLSLYPGFC